MRPDLGKLTGCICFDGPAHLKKSNRVLNTLDCRTKLATWPKMCSKDGTKANLNAWAAQCPFTCGWCSPSLGSFPVCEDELGRLTTEGDQTKKCADKLASWPAMCAKKGNTWRQGCPHTCGDCATPVPATPAPPVGTTFDPATKGSKIQLSNGDRSATSSNLNHSWNSVYGTDCYSSVVHSWSVTVDKLADHTGNFWEMIIGIGRPENPNTWLSYSSTYSTLNKGYGYIQQNGHRTNQGSPDHKAFGAATYGAGDTITVHADLDAKTVSFDKNGVSQGQSHTGILSATYCLAVSIGDSGDAVTVV